MSGKVDISSTVPKGQRPPLGPNPLWSNVEEGHVNQTGSSNIQAIHARTLSISYFPTPQGEDSSAEQRLEHNATSDSGPGGMARLDFVNAWLDGWGASKFNFIQPSDVNVVNNVSEDIIARTFAAPSGSAVTNIPSSPSSGRRSGSFSDADFDRNKDRTKGTSNPRPTHGDAAPQMAPFHLSGDSYATLVNEIVMRVSLRLDARLNQVEKDADEIKRLREENAAYKRTIESHERLIASHNTQIKELMESREASKKASGSHKQSNGQVLAQFEKLRQEMANYKLDVQETITSQIEQGLTDVLTSVRQEMDKGYVRRDVAIEAKEEGAILSSPALTKMKTEVMDAIGAQMRENAAAEREVFQQMRLVEASVARKETAAAMRVALGRQMKVIEDKLADERSARLLVQLDNTRLRNELEISGRHLEAYIAGFPAELADGFRWIGLREVAIRTCRALEVIAKEFNDLHPPPSHGVDKYKKHRLMGRESLDDFASKIMSAAKLKLEDDKLNNCLETEDEGYLELLVNGQSLVQHLFKEAHSQSKITGNVFAHLFLRYSSSYSAMIERLDNAVEQVDFTLAVSALRQALPLETRFYRQALNGWYKDIFRRLKKRVNGRTVIDVEDIKKSPKDANFLYQIERHFDPQVWTKDEENGEYYYLNRFVTDYHDKCKKQGTNRVEPLDENSWIDVDEWNALSWTKPSLTDDKSSTNTGTDTEPVLVTTQGASTLV